MARKPYVPLNTQPACDPVTPEQDCKPGDRNVRAMVSDDPGNSIQQRPDGLFAPAIIYRENTVVAPADDSISVVESETTDGFRKFDVGTRISLEDGNLVELRDDGLFVSVPEELTEDPILLTQGGLIYTPLVPGQGIITYTGDRNIIRIQNGLNNIVLPLGEAFDRMEEIYLVQDGQRTMPVNLLWDTGVTVDNVPGPASRTFGPGSSIHILRHTAQQWLVLAGGGVDEAPFDNQPYTRQNGIWVQQHSQVLPAMALGEPEDLQPLDVNTSQFNRIVHISDGFESLDLKRQYVGNYQDHFEATFIKDDPFLVKVPMGVRINGFEGPLGFNVEAKPKGCVLKKVSSDNWLLMGAVQQDGSVEPLPPITTMEFPGSGTFRGVARLMDGTILYDMTGNTTMLSSVHSLKNLIIAAIVIDEQAAYLDMKDRVYLTAYRTGLTDNLSDLQDGDLVSYRDLLTLLLHESYEDVAVMISSLLGSGDHAVFTAKMNSFIAGLETPLVSSFYGAALSIADPVGISNAYKMADWIQHIETEYTAISALLREGARVFNIFGVNAREYTSTNQNPYLAWLRTDYGKVNNLVNGSFPFWGTVQKLEMPSDIPVYLSMHQFATELERHLAVTSAMMGLEDDFTFLTGDATDFDASFSNVSLLLGNSASLIDRSNVANQVFLSPIGLTTEERNTKGWIRSYALNGTTGYITVYDNPSIRLGSSNFTMEMFFRGNGLQTNMTLFAKDGLDIEDRSFMLRLVDQTLQMTYTLDGDTEPNVWNIVLPTGIKNLLLNGARRHLCWQRSGNTLGLFINGRLLGTLVLPPGAAFQDCGMPLNIGCNGDPLWLPNPESGWYGRFKMDNLRLTKGITRYSMAGFPVRTTPFKNGSGS